MFEDDYYDLNVNDSFNIDSISIIRSESDNLYKYEIDDCLKSLEDVHFINRKRTGRKKKQEGKRGIHSKFHLDNINIKILVNFIRFLFDFINKFLEENKVYNKQFFKISGEFLKKRNLILLKKIINSPLSYILKQNISKKYKQKSKKNKELLKEIIGINNQQLNNLLDMKLKYIYSEIYIKNNSSKLYNEYGIKKKVNMLNEFLECLKKKNENEYVESIRISCDKLISHIEKTKPKTKEKENIINN